MYIQRENNIVITYSGNATDSCYKMKVDAVLAVGDAVGGYPLIEFIDSISSTLC